MMRRRELMRMLGAGASMLAVPSFLRAADAEKPAGKRPNVLLIMTDQQHAGMMSCAGNPWVKTPAMDSLAQRGIRFERAYTSNPVCVPARFAMFTGEMPSKAKFESNGDGMKTKVDPAIVKQSMGLQFRDAGYETAYGGKVHLPMGLGEMGFTCISRDERAGLADACVKFLEKPHEKPFLLVASFINPHDICAMEAPALMKMKPEEIKEESLRKAMELPPGMTREQFFATTCPPLPQNFEVSKDEPNGVGRVASLIPMRKNARSTWNEKQWRMYRWVYCRLVERVDAEIGTVLTALKKSGLDKNTVVVFTSDHGEMDGAHRLVRKALQYDEAVRVPFIVSGCGVAKPGTVDAKHMVNSGIDLIPTLCGMAGIELRGHFPGRSLKPLVEGKEPESWRGCCISENNHSRMVRTDQYKYIVYDGDGGREQLFDVKNDPGETKNLAGDQKHMATLDMHRNWLKHWYEEHGETLDPKYIIPPSTTKPSA